MNLKKICIILIILSGISLNCFGQNNDVNINITTGTNSEEDYLYRINGISTTEDIGGVEISHVNESNRLLFQNYNTFTVTVIFEVETNDGRKRTGTIVLRSYEKKESLDAYPNPVSYVLISRKLSS